MEKPIDGGLQPVLAERAALEAGADRFLMGFQYRYHPGLIQVRSLIAENTIGRVLSYRIHWTNAYFLPSTNKIFKFFKTLI